jgi:glycosyltransferase involved in cell wall biosynthesis
MAGAVVKWICAQDGAREHYALPRALHREGRLALLATEFWAGRGLRAGRMAALGSRWDPDLDDARIISWNAHYILRRFNRAVTGERHDNSYEAFVRNGRWLSEKVRNFLERHAVELGDKVVFSYDTTALELFELSRRRGARCVLGQMDPNRVEFELVREEEKRWPGWALRETKVPGEYLARREQEWALADRVLVNSEFCRQALLRQGVPEEKLVVVPLCYEDKAHTCRAVGTAEGIANCQSPIAKDQTLIARSPSPMANGHWPTDRKRKDRALRVLFLGQVILRKGIQYLVEAAKLLRDENVFFDVVGPIGISDASIESAPPNVIFHGRVMRDNAGEWYRRADVFVLPTLSDGFAITQLEAMAHGLPVIATPNCGDVVTHGVDGFIIPIRDSVALAGAVGRYRNPNMLAAHRSAAVNKAAGFSIENLSRRLLALATSILIS